MTKNETFDIFYRSHEPLDVSFLVLPGVSFMCVASAVDPLRAANRVTGREVFSWKFVSPDGQPAASTCGLPVDVSGAFDPYACGDVLIVVASFGVREYSTSALSAKLRQAARRVRAVGGIEAGSLVLARAGLLENRAATTHWEDLEDFASTYPGTDVRPDRYVIDGPIFTTGGASPTFDLMLHLIRSRLGVATALDVGSVFIYEQGKAASDAQPLVSLGSPENHDPRVIDAIHLMEDRIDRPLSTAAIAKRLRLSVRSLEKLFRMSIGETPGAYFIRLRLSVARRMVTDTRTPIADIADRTGFSSASAFSRAFAKAFGSPPAAVRRAHTRSSATAMP